LIQIEKIDWYRNKDPQSYAGWTSGPPTFPPDEKYFIYGKNQYAHNLRTEYFKDLLLISSRGEDNVVDILLNPRVISEDGEWEAWELSPRLPGAHRFRSFTRLMEWLYVCEIASFEYFARAVRS
jgi:hypothetical protein